MADICEAVRTSLLANQALSDEIGARMVPDELAQGETLPAVTYRRISTTHSNTINGSKAGMAETRIGFECFASTRAKADEVAELIRLSGVLDLSGLTNGVDIQAVQVDAGISHEAEQNTEGSHELRYITAQDYAFTYLETV